ncbi:MAG: hypothetical protein KatS3mg031_1149 [Chitinophagales bacterium]|nr:MAG: hypothetical protein KatS3mg031_1149 [Chitinophagales bacterium]
MVSLIIPPVLQQNSITRIAVEDVTDLLRKACHCEVYWNKDTANVKIILPATDPDAEHHLTQFEKQWPYPILHYPEQDYQWESTDSAGVILLRLYARTAQAISFGLYGLLQEKLGFQFYHPREMIIPSFERWPLPAAFTWKASPRFHKRGFHLHTQHPLELTEDLMHPYSPESRQRIREYIDWLARNQQNYFEFNLLESVWLPEWIPYFQFIIEYGHQRGILMGVDLSMRMIQQKAFMLYRNFPASWRTKKKQIDRNLRHLCKADWDVFNIEFSTTEFSKGNEKKKRALQRYITDRLVNQYSIKPMGRMHVVKDERMIDRRETSSQSMSVADSLLDQNRGILIHTVMFYSLTDSNAPVYGNENLLHMLDALLYEQQYRETWYYPESAYWITFDNSVPMFLAPYLSARLEDILLCDSLQVTGHITFSSGWEWGYWLIDWSIARWSWQHEENGTIRQPRPDDYLNELLHDASVTTGLLEALRLQQLFLKDSGLIAYLTAQTVTDELPRPFNLQLHPRPKLSYRQMFKNPELAAKELQPVVTSLIRFANQTDSILTHTEAAYSRNSPQSPQVDKIFNEIMDGLRITSLRARQRVSIFQAMMYPKQREAHLQEAELIRQRALQVVRRREAEYRYPVSLLAGRYYSHTAYNYGYLYPVHNLHFWKREEMQIRKNRWGPFFMSIWNVARIIGISE